MGHIEEEEREGHSHYEMPRVRDMERKKLTAI